MTKAEKIIRDILNDCCGKFNVSDTYEEHTFRIFNMSFEIPGEKLVYIDLLKIKELVKALNVSYIAVQYFDKGFFISIKRISARLLDSISTVEGVKVNRDVSVGPVKCNTCKEIFKTLAIALEHVELVHRGDVELDGTFDAQQTAKA